MKGFLIWLLKLVLKLFLLPVVICMTILQILSDVAAAIALTIFDLLGFILIMTGILSAGFGIESAQEVWRTLAVGAAFYIFPRLLVWLSADLALLNMRLRSWLLL